MQKNVNENPKLSYGRVLTQDGKIITVDALLASEKREDGWVHAIAEFQTSVTRLSEGD
jgi:hypothetical protein